MLHNKINLHTHAIGILGINNLPCSWDKWTKMEKETELSLVVIYFPT